MNSISELLFHTPWWLPVIIAATGVILFITGNNRQEFRVRTAGMAVFFLAILLIVVSYFVDTPLEKAVDRTRQFARAVEKRDWPAVRALLDRRTSLAVMNSTTVYANGNLILQGAQDGVERYGLKTVRILSCSGQQQGPLINVTLDVLTEQEVLPQPLPSGWQFEWDLVDNDVILRRIVNLRIGNATADTAKAQFPKR